MDFPLLSCNSSTLLFPNRLRCGACVTFAIAFCEFTEIHTAAGAAAAALVVLGSLFLLLHYCCVLPLHSCTFLLLPLAL